MKAAEILILLRRENCKATLALRHAWGALVADKLNHQDFSNLHGFHSLAHMATVIYESSPDIR